MSLTPEKIYREFTNNEIDKDSAITLLISLVENVDNLDVRLDSIKTIQKLGFKSQRFFDLLENLLISDDNQDIRILAAWTLAKIFKNKSLKPLNWALNNETSMKYFLEITSIFTKINSEDAKKILIKKIEDIDKLPFISSFNRLFSTHPLHTFGCKSLATIINNYFIIKYIEEKNVKFSYKLKNGLITELDLAHITSTVKGWEIIKNLSKFIDKFQELKKISLKDDKIGTFPPNILSLSYLAHLNLSHNLLKQIPESIYRLQSLKFLDLRYNKIKLLPDTIGKLRLLRVLDLRHNKLMILPASIGELESLEVLNLYGNQLEELPSTLKQLKKLELGLNSLINIPAYVKELNSLEKLGLGSNKNLENPSEWLETIPSIKELNLSNINLNNLPESIGYIQTLESLTLNNNKLKKLPDSLKKLTFLKKLNLSWNNFSFLPDWIGCFSNLEELNLEGNKLNTLPKTLSSIPP